MPDYDQANIRPGEGVEIIIKGQGINDDNDKIEMTLFFRGKEYPLDIK